MGLSMQSEKYVRVQGYRHSYPPITLGEEDAPDKIVILDMTRHMNKLKMSSYSVGAGKASQTLTTAISQSGASLESFLVFAETHGYGVENTPVIGGYATVGGVMAVGAHGAGIPALNEKLSKTGFSFGSLSNLIVALTAVVWNPSLGKYTLKTFSRTDPDIAAILVHIGRAVITEIAVLVGPNYNMQCLSRVDVSSTE